MRRFEATFLLLLVTVIWGVACVTQRIASYHMTALGFTSARFLLGGICLLPLVMWRARRCDLRVSWFTTPGVVLGITLAVACVLNQVGAGQTTSANLGFLTIANVAFVPILSHLIGHTTRLLELLGVIIILTGAYFMSVNSDFVIQSGDLWVLLSAVFFAIHIILIKIMVTDRDPIKLAMEQFIICGFLSLIASAIFEHPLSQDVIGALPAIIYAGAISAAVGYTFQIAAQRYVSSTQAVVLLSLEGVFASIAGWLILGELMSAQAICGGFLIMLGVFVSNITDANQTSSKT